MTHISYIEDMDQITKKRPYINFEFMISNFGDFLEVRHISYTFIMQNIQVTHQFTINIVTDTSIILPTYFENAFLIISTS